MCYESLKKKKLIIQKKFNHSFIIWLKLPITFVVISGCIICVVKFAVLLAISKIVLSDLKINK